MLAHRSNVFIVSERNRKWQARQCSK